MPTLRKTRTKSTNHAGGQEAITTSLDTIRYHSGIAGEEVADMVDSLEQEVSTLREQVEKLTKERDTEIARNRPLQSLIKSTEETKSFLLKKSEENKEAVKQLDSERQANAVLTEELAALAEQNEKMRAFVTKISEQTPEKPDYWSSCGQCEHNSSNAEDLLELPDLASPVLNRIRAEGMREAEKIVRKRVQWVSNGQGIQYRSTAPESISAESLADEIRARAAELEKTNG